MSTFIVSPPSDSALLTRMVLPLPADLLRLMIGFNSEKMTAVDPTQITIDLGDQSNIATTGPATASDDAAGPEWPRLRKPRAASRNMGALPGHMPRHEELIEMKIATCPCCNLELHHLRKDFSEAHDIVPALARTIRPKYACRSFEDDVSQAPARARMMNVGKATTALVAHVVASKFGWYLSLYQQAQMLAGTGLDIDRGTLGGWVARATWWLKPLHVRLLGFIRVLPRVYRDEPSLPRLDPRRDRAKVCQLWAPAIDDPHWNGPARPAGGYVFTDGRGTDELEAQWGRFCGGVQVEGYGDFKIMAKRRPKSNAAPLRLAFCLARARSKFADVVKTTGLAEALTVIGKIAEVYLIESRIRGLIAEARLAGSAALMSALKAQLKKLMAEFSTKSSIGKAAACTLGHLQGLSAFRDDGRIEMDSNIIKPVFLKRKNALSFGSKRGGESCASLASLVNTAKLNGIDPELWLADVLERIVSGATPISRIDTLQPWSWKAEREALRHSEVLVA